MPNDIHYAFFGNVVRGKSAPFRLVVRNGFAHFVRKVMGRRKLLPGKFWVFAPLVSASDYEDNDNNKKDGTGNDDIENNTNYTVNWG